MNIRTYTLPALLVGALFAASSAQAATATATLTVKLVLAGTCSVTTTDVDFGTSTNLGATVQSTGAVNVNCTDQTPYQVSLDKGLGNGASVTARKMTNLADSTKTANYELHFSSHTGPIWGDSTGGTIFSSAGVGAGQVHTVYGSVPAQTHPGDGTYQDTVNVTVIW